MSRLGTITRTEFGVNFCFEAILDDKISKFYFQKLVELTLAPVLFILEENTNERMSKDEGTLFQGMSQKEGVAVL